MSWKESDRVSERREFLELASQPGVNFSLLCKRFGISRKTGYKWRKRQTETGDLSDQSRRPKSSPNRTNERTEDEVLRLRAEHPTWGGRKLRNRLQNLGMKDAPSPSTITEILRRHSKLSEPPGEGGSFTRFECSEANSMWQMDFKGEFALSPRQKCYPLTLLDDHSRFSLGIIAQKNQRGDTVKKNLTGVFRKYGIPYSIYVDNGTPWGNSSGIFRHTKLSVWLMRHDIEIIHGRPYHPQGRGKLERFHRTLKQEVLQDRQFGTLGRTQKCFDKWREVYNHDRPHEALDDNVPSSRFQVSERTFRGELPKYEYSPRFTTRRANRGSEIHFHGRDYRISQVFIDQQVGLLPTSRDGVWDIYFCRFLVGRLNEHTGKIRRTSCMTEFRNAQSSHTAGEQSD